MSFLVLIVASGVLGTLLLHGIDDQGVTERWLFRLYVGLSISAVIIIVLGSFSLRAAQCALYLIAAAGLGHELFFRKETLTTSSRHNTNDAPRDRLWYISAAALACATIPALAAVLAPVTGWDATVAHIALPQDYTRIGRICVLEGNDYSAYPHLLHSLFTYCYYESGERAVTLLNGMFGLLGCVALYVLGRRIEHRNAGMVAAAAFATAPVFIDQVGGASVDLAFAGMSVAALAAAVAWYDTEDRAWLLLAALLAGSSCGIRHTGYLVCVLLGAGVVLARSPSRFDSAIQFGAAVVLGALPWLTRSALLTGNPFYPFFAEFVSPGTLPAEPITRIAGHWSVRGTTLKDLAMFPWNIVMRPHWYDGWSKSPGGLVLFLGIPGLIVGGKRALPLGLYSIAGGACFFYFQRFARYILPFFLPMMVLAGVAACRLQHHYRRLPWLVMAAFGYGLLLALAAVHFKFPVIMGVEQREAYLERRVERYPAFVWANNHLLDGVTLSFDPRSYFFTGPAYCNYDALKFIREKSIAEQLEWLRRRDIRYVFVPRTYLEETEGLQAIGMLDIANQWTEQPDRFEPIAIFDALERPRAGGVERVEIYRVRYDGRNIRHGTEPCP